MVATFGRSVNIIDKTGLISIVMQNNVADLVHSLGIEQLVRTSVNMLQQVV